MSTSVTTAFITYFDPMFKAAYQKMMARARDKVRVSTGFTGSTVDFQKIGKGAATGKTRHGDVVAMNLAHTKVTATMVDKYAAEYIDEADLKRANIDMVSGYNEAITGALGRALDDQIFTAMATTTTTVAEGSAGLTEAKILSAFEKLNGYDVPGGDRFCAVGPHQWNELLSIDAFASSDYVGSERLPWLQEASGRNWLGINWYMDTGLPLSSGTRTCFMWHKQAVGLGELIPFTRKMDYIPKAVSWQLLGYYSAGAALIETEGVVAIACLDDAAIV